MRALVLVWILTSKTLALYQGVGNIIGTSTAVKEIIKPIDRIDPTDFSLECALGDINDELRRVDYEDIHLNVTQLIAKYNYPVEEHYVTTTDGYILTIIRMRNQGPIVFLMHGFLSSADDFVTMNLPNSIAYNLWLDGFEVWIGNARGNKYSRRHVILNPDIDKEYWDFSWDEIGRIDLTNTIDYILERTGKSQIIYIGHSQGTTAYFVMCSERPEYNGKVALMISLSAVVYMTHLKSPPIRMLAPISENVELISQLIGYYEILPSDLFTKFFTTLLCSQPHLASLICTNIVSILCGFDCAQTDISTAPVVYRHIPSGSATKQLIHYLQEVKSGRFRRYDHGPQKNLKVYGTIAPPDYDIGKISSPIAIFYCDNDWLSNITDVQVLISQLPNVVEIYRVPFARFSHNDYVFSKNLKTLVYSRLVELVKTYSVKTKW